MSREYGGRGGNREGGRGGGMGIRPDYFLPKPVKVGDEIEVTIEATASRGDGIAKKDGFVIFVKDGKQGQTAKIRITDVRAKFAVGELVDSQSSASSAPEAAPDESEGQA